MVAAGPRSALRSGSASSRRGNDSRPRRRRRLRLTVLRRRISCARDSTARGASRAESASPDSPRLSQGNTFCQGAGSGAGPAWITVGADGGAVPDPRESFSDLSRSLPLGATFVQQTFGHSAVTGASSLGEHCFCCGVAPADPPDGRSRRPVLGRTAAPTRRAQVGRTTPVPLRTLAYRLQAVTGYLEPTRQRAIVRGRLRTFLRPSLRHVSRRRVAPGTPRSPSDA
jgi:hypothetical protein